MTEDELHALVGHRLPGGTFTLSQHRQWLINDVLHGEPGPFPSGGEPAHPLFAYLGSAAMGISWDEMFALCGSSAEDGPMFGEHESVLYRPLRVGEDYAVTGEITAADRKQGRRAGVFDIIAFELEIRDGAGELMATTMNSIVYPRRQG